MSSPCHLDMHFDYDLIYIQPCPPAFLAFLSGGVIIRFLVSREPQKRTIDLRLLQVKLLGYLSSLDSRGQPLFLLLGDFVFRVVPNMFSLPSYSAESGGGGEGGVDYRSRPYRSARSLARSLRRCARDRYSQPRYEGWMFHLIILSPMLRDHPPNCVRRGKARA